MPVSLDPVTEGVVRLLEVNRYAGQVAQESESYRATALPLRI